MSPAVTVMVTVSAGEMLVPSETVRENTSEALDASCEGAVKVGLSAVEELRVTVGVPEVWLHEYVSVSPSVSELALPSSVTSAPSDTVWSVPALAVGVLSSLVIVPVPEAAEMEALEAELMVTITVSLLSLRVSPVTATSMSLEVSPAEKVRVPAVIAV